jgi:ABC-2 type transport system permease protein
MKAIIKKLFNKRIKTINLIQIINAGLVLLYAGTFPLLASQQEAMMGLLKSLPQELLKAFSIDNSSITSFQSYLASKHIVPFWVIILLMVAIPAGTFISKSISNKSSELLFAQPVSRIRISVSVLLSALLQGLYYVVTSIALIFPICWIFGIEINYTAYLYFTIASIGFSIFITSLVFFLDGIIFDGGKVMGLMIVSIIGMYALDVLSKIVTDLDFLKYFSIFHYFDANLLLGKAQFDIYSFILFIICGIIFTVAGVWLFNRRDLIK